MRKPAQKLSLECPQCHKALGAILNYGRAGYASIEVVCLCGGLCTSIEISELYEVEEAPRCPTGYLAGQVHQALAESRRTPA